MSQNKNDKIKQFETETIETVASYVGYVAMSVAAVAGLIEMHESRQHKMGASMQPAFAVAAEVPVEVHGEELDTETRHMSTSYGTTMRSSSVSGKV